VYVAHGGTNPENQQGHHSNMEQTKWYNTQTVTFVRFLLILISVTSYLNLGVEVNSRNFLANEEFQSPKSLFAIQ
jgi:hypothetical protein